ncbi:MAG: D-alanyl-D-alanine carboxypeptidase/D-alanyl-D-alanine-endopeptidase [Acidimicrobiales bacterium]
MNRRVLGVATLLILVGIGLAAVGWRQETQRSDRVTSTPVVESPGDGAPTPILSARRVPELLVRPQASRRLTAKLTPVLDKAPAQTCAVVADGATTLFARKPDEPMPAASNQKILTALVALDVLGADFRFTTKLAATAAPSGGVIAGDLWVIGGGDPVIDSDTYQSTLHYGSTPHTRVEDIADKIVASGITRVDGSVKGDDTRYDDQRVVSSWPARYIQQNQVGPLSALSVNDARTYAVIPGTQAGTPQPAADPPAYAATALTQLLQARGVTVTGLPGSGSAPAGLTTVTEVASLPLSDIVKEMLTFSDNNTAELLLKAVGLQDGKAGTTADGLAVAKQVLTEHHLDLNGVVLLDGSGLDIGNRLTCRLLETALGDAGPDGPLANGLAVADGPDGTLRDRFTNSPAAGAVRAKTGTLKAVTALSGWVTTTKGANVRFSVVLNTGGRDVSGSDLTLETRVAEAIMSYPDAVDPAVVGPRPVP